MTIVDLQVSPAHADWHQLRDVAQAAEAYGFGAFWVFDHLAGHPLGGTTMLESFTLLGALAQTTTIELGTMVANVWNRQVGTLVTAAASVALVSGRPFHLGIGAGAAPGSRWSVEQRAVGAFVEPDLRARHDRVREVLELAAAQWRPDRDAAFATFPLPTPAPTLLVGVNSVGLSRVAGRLADGINVRWNDERRDEFLAAAGEEAGDRPFLRTAYLAYDAALLDPGHPERVEMRRRGIGRLILAAFDDPPRLG